MDQTVNNGGDHIELSQLNGLIEAAGVEGAQEILDAFWRSTKDMLDQLSAQLTDNDFSGAACTCHAIKGMSANVGAARLSATVAELEVACKANDSASITTKLSAACADFDAAQSWLQDYLRQAS